MIVLLAARPSHRALYLPSSYFSTDESGLLRILEEHEWRGIGITQSLGWQHFEVHGELLGDLDCVSHD